MTRADCTVRALAAVTGMSYDAAHDLTEDAGRSRGRRFSAQRQIEYAKRRGLNFTKLRFNVRTIERFCRENPKGRFYVRIRGHALAVIDGVPSDSTSTLARIIDAWQYHGGQVAAKPERVKVVKPPVDKRALKYARTLAAIERWNAKQRRAANALKRLGRSLRAQERAIQKSAPANSTTVH